jgi:hypothetical protein
VIKRIDYFRSSNDQQKIKKIRMKKLVSFCILSVMFNLAIGQTLKDSSEKVVQPISSIESRAKDHLHFQLGSVMWLQRPDSISSKGLSRSFNAYLFFDIPFKTDPRFSIGVGVGAGSDHIFFDKNGKRDLDITSDNGISYRRLTGADTNTRYKSIKLHTAYLEAPVELRFMSKPFQHHKSLKFALGMKIGTLVAAVDKTRFERDGVGNRNYNTKVKDRKNFNNLRVAGYARVGYGNFGLFFQYQLNDFIKEGQGPNQIRPFQAGFTFSGL